MTLRDAESTDASVILTFIRELAEYERLLHECVATEDDVRRTLFGSDPAARVVLAEWDGEPAGFALYFRTYSTFLAGAGIYLEDLYVRPAFRGRGLGRALIAELERRLATEGGGRLEWSVLDWNEPSIQFYESIGARPRVGWTVYRMVVPQS